MLLLEPGVCRHGKALPALYMPFFMLESSHPIFSLSSQPRHFHYMLLYVPLIALDLESLTHVDKHRTSLSPLVPAQRVQQLRHTLPSTRANSEEDQTWSHRNRHEPRHLIDAAVIHPAA